MKRSPMCRVVRCLLFAAVALHTALATGVAQDPPVSAPASPLPPYRNRLLGVFDAQSGEPIEGAQVSDALTKTSALTTVTGTVSLVFLPDGGSLVRIVKVGYKPHALMVEISPADTLPLTILLEAATTALPTVVTTDSAPAYLSPGLRGFEERRKQHIGRYITEAELRKSDNRKMANVLRQLPSIRIACARRGRRQGECWAVSNRQSSRMAVLGGACTIDLYIDGLRTSDNDLEKLSVNHFAAVEYYSGAATIPPQFNGTGSTCGVIALWTRER